MQQDAMILLLLTIQKGHNKNCVQQCLDAVPELFVKDQKRKIEFEEFGNLLGKKKCKKGATSLKCSRWVLFLWEKCSMARFRYNYIQEQERRILEKF